MTAVADMKVKTLSKKQVADMYGITVKTLMTWLNRKPHLKHLAKDDRQLYTPAELLLIFDNKEGIGEP